MKKKPLLIVSRVHELKVVIILGMSLVLIDIIFSLLHQRPAGRIFVNAILESSIAVFGVCMVFGIRYTILGIQNLFGVDITGNLEPPIRITCETLFNPDSFDPFRQKAIHCFERGKMSIIPIIGGLIVAGALYIPALITGIDEPHGIDPYPVVTITASEINELWVIRSVLTFIIVTWLVTGWLDVVLLLINIIRVSSLLGKDPGLSIRYLDEIVNPDKEKGYFDFDSRSLLVRFSLKRFKKKAAIIPQFILGVNILVLCFVSVAGTGVFIFSTLFSKPNARMGLMIGVFIVIAAVVIIDFLLFLLPQLSLKRLISERKQAAIEPLEEIYEFKKYQWLRLASSEEEETKRRILWNDIQVLMALIDEIESILSWPFNYGQLLTVIGWSTFTLLLPIGLEYIVFQLILGS
ncbi:MAG: hypothetical protein ACFFD4_36925 [Candidatus Odinarchaeota archaeon]